jgi:hypothetical protein
MAYKDEDKERFIQLFKSNATNVSSTCKAMAANFQRSTYYDWYNAGGWFKEAIDAAREDMCDFGESQLFTLMKGIPKLDENNRIVDWVMPPSAAAIIFFNKTRNKNRGYVERMEVRQRNETPSINMAKLTADERQALYDLLDKADADNAPDTD